VKRSVVCVVSSADSSCNFDSMPNKPKKRRNVPDVEPSDTDSSSSDWERDVLPDVIGKPSAPVKKAAFSRPTGMAAGGRPGVHRGQGMRGLPPLGRGNAMPAARAAPRFGKRGRGGPRVAMRGYIPRRCGLCNHVHIFDTRSGLNQQSARYKVPPQLLFAFGGLLQTNTGG